MRREDRIRKAGKAHKQTRRVALKRDDAAELQKESVAGLPRCAQIGSQLDRKRKPRRREAVTFLPFSCRGGNGAFDRRPEPEMASLDGVWFDPHGRSTWLVYQ